MYDGKIGGWLSTDPYNVGFTPYNGMVNNSVNMDEPDGRYPDDINYDTSTGQTTVTKTNDDFDRYYVDNKYKGWAGKGTGSLLWSQNGGQFGLPDSFIPLGDFNKGYMLSTVIVNGNQSNDFTGVVNYGNYIISSTLLRDRLMQFSSSINRPITITGGDRSVSRNRAVGGANQSRHLFHDAGDLTVNGISNRDLATMAHNSGLFNTVIYYPPVDATGALRPHLHVDLNPNHDNNLLIYTPNIVHGRVIRNSYSPMTGN